MRSFLLFLILLLALVEGARFAYRELRPPSPDYPSGPISAASELASLPRTCRPAEPPKAVSTAAQKAQAFDLDGIRLYMPAREAVAAVGRLSQFKATPDVVLASCVSDALEYGHRVRASDKPGREMPKQSCINKISYHSPREDLDLDLDLDLVEDLPGQPGCMVVKRVSSERDELMTGDAAEMRLKEKLEAKYGRLGNLGTAWGDEVGARLVLTRTRTNILLELTDTAFERQKNQARTKIVDDANAKAEADARAKAKAKRRPPS